MKQEIKISSGWLAGKPILLGVNTKDYGFMPLGCLYCSNPIEANDAMVNPYGYVVHNHCHQKTTEALEALKQ